MDVVKLSYNLPITDEDIVDGFAMRSFLYPAMGLDTPTMTTAEVALRDEAEARLAVKDAERRAAWLGLPLRVRVARTIRSRLYMPRLRFSAAIAAFRDPYGRD